MEGDGEGPAGLGHLDRPGTGAAGQLVRQLVNLPLSFGIQRELVLHGDLGQLLLSVLDTLPQADLVLTDAAGPVQQQFHKGGHHQGAEGQEAAPKKQVHVAGFFIQLIWKKYHDLTDCRVSEKLKTTSNCARCLHRDSSP